jgi:hypothetical protein
MLQGWADWRYPGTILDQMLTVFNKTAPGNIKAVAFLKSKYSTIQALNTAWYALALSAPHTPHTHASASGSSDECGRTQEHDLRQF